jgi:hypothetical protein
LGEAAVVGHSARTRACASVSVAWTSRHHRDANLLGGLREGLEIFLVLFLMLSVIDVLGRFRRMREAPLSKHSLMTTVE